ncbi:MAG: universal stress protein [Longimicrobiales bacterium]|nr:universal stress protein [Longimicrobiales bacterium]
MTDRGEGDGVERNESEQDGPGRSGSNDDGKEPVTEAWPRSSVLVEVELPEPVELAPRLVEVIGSLRVVLLGSYLVPEQTAPEQARDQLEEECAQVLDALVAELEEAGADVDAHMVFTPDLLDTAARVAREEDCDAILLARPLPRLERILVPLRGAHHLRPMASFLGSLLVESDAQVTFLHVQEEDEEEGFGTWVLGEAKDLLGEAGIDPERIETRIVPEDEGEAVEAVLREARDHDLLVLGESEPEVPDLLFGTFSERVAEDAEIPVFVMRRRE